MLTDPARLAAVHASGLLETRSHPALDGLTRAIARMLDAPLAAVTLMTDAHQVFVSAAGTLAGRVLAYERPVARALCRHVVTSDAPLAVADTARSAITRDDHAVRIEGVRAYAGVPLRLRDGQVVGTLCAFALEPRPFDADDVAVLEDLAEAAAAAIEARSDHRADVAEARARLQRALTCDHLTGLPGRTMLETRVAELLATRSPTDPLTALCLDLDGFGLVNASFGQSCGDEILREVARRLAPLAAAGLVARHGGDRFLLVSERDPADAARVVGATLARPFALHGTEFHLGSSTGVGVWPEDGVDALSLLQHAEEALDQSRHRTRGGVSRYSTPGVDARRRLTLTSRLRRALEADALELHYQPIVPLCARADAAHGGLPGFEALLRWTDGTHGPVRPDVFIPAAEDAGMMDELGSWVLEAACRQVHTWAAAGLDAHVAINVSPRQLEHGLLPDQVDAALSLCGVPRERLSLELTESAVMREGAAADASLHAMAELGVALAIDDFGTGHSSLSRLRDLPFTTLKLDRAFLAGVPAVRQDAEVVDAVLGLAQALGMTVVAEGVETEEQHDFLVDRGCFAAQGWLYARALPAAEATALLRRGGLSAAMRA